MGNKNFFLPCLALLGFCAVCSPAGALGLQPLDDAALAEVTGGGMSIAVLLDHSIGSIQYGVYDTPGNAATLTERNYLLTGTFLATLDVLPGAAGQPDYLDSAFPLLNTSHPLQLGYDLEIAADGSTLGTGVTFQNIAIAGSSMQLTTADTGGVAFGVAINASVDHILLQPVRGSTTGQMDISGVTLGGITAGSPWILADLVNQRGEFHILPQGGVLPDQFQWTIKWPDRYSGPGASSGSLQINNITFATPGGPVNIGSSSIGSMQIQYLNVKFKS